MDESKSGFEPEHVRLRAEPGDLTDARRRYRRSPA